MEAGGSGHILRAGAVAPVRLHTPSNYRDPIATSPPCAPCRGATVGCPSAARRTAWNGVELNGRGASRRRSVEASKHRRAGRHARTAWNGRSVAGRASIHARRTRESCSEDARTRGVQPARAVRRCTCMRARNHGARTVHSVVARAQAPSPPRLPPYSRARPSHARSIADRASRPPCAALHYTALHCIPLHPAALHCITLRSAATCQRPASDRRLCIRLAARPQRAGVIAPIAPSSSPIVILIDVGADRGATGRCGVRACYGGYGTASTDGRRATWTWTWT